MEIKVNEIYADCFAHSDIEEFKSLGATIGQRHIVFPKPVMLDALFVLRHSIGRTMIIHSNKNIIVRNTRGKIQYYRECLRDYPSWFRSKSVNLYYGNIDFENRCIEVKQYENVDSNSIPFVKIKENLENGKLIDIKQIGELSRFSNFKLDIKKYPKSLKNINVEEELFKNGYPIDIDIHNLPFRISKSNYRTNEEIRFPNKRPIIILNRTDVSLVNSYPYYGLASNKYSM